MQLLHPWLLLGLLLVPAAVLLHVFRAPGRRHEVSFLGLWQSVLRRVTPEASERLKRLDWLLLLEILVLVLLVLALARPVIWRERPHRRIGVIHDISASMKTVDPDGKTRFEQGRRAIAPVFDRLSRDDATDYYFGPSAPIWQSMLRLELIAEGIIAPADLAIEPEKLLADGLAKFGSAPQVVFLVTDKPPARIQDPRVRVIAVGGPSRNAGIVSFLDTPVIDGSHEIFLRVRNFADSPAARKLVLANASKPLASEDLLVGPRGSVERVFSVRLAPEDPVLRAKLEGADDGFPADDEVAAVQRPLMVVATGADLSPAYARLFGGPVFEGTIYVEAPDDAPVPPDSLVIAQGVLPKSLGALTVVVNPPAGRIAGIQIGNPRLLAQRTSPFAVSADPLIAGVALLEFQLADFRSLTLDEHARPLMQAAGETVAAVADAGGSKVIVLGFDPTRAGWSLKPSFVVFWANVLAAAKKSTGAGGLVFCRPGDIVDLPFDPGDGLADGATPVRGRNGWSVCQPVRVGVHEWTTHAGRKGFFAVNLLSETESDNRPSPLVDKPPSLDLPAPLAGTAVPLAPWLCLLAAGLAVTWWHFRR